MRVFIASLALFATAIAAPEEFQQKLLAKLLARAPSEAFTASGAASRSASRGHTPNMIIDSVNPDDLHSALSAITDLDADHLHNLHSVLTDHAALTDHAGLMDHSALTDGVDHSALTDAAGTEPSSAFDDSNDFLSAAKQKIPGAQRKKPTGVMIPVVPTPENDPLFWISTLAPTLSFTGDGAPRIVLGALSTFYTLQLGWRGAILPNIIVPGVMVATGLIDTPVGEVFDAFELIIRDFGYK